MQGARHSLTEDFKLLWAFALTGIDWFMVNLQTARSNQSGNWQYFGKIY